MDINGGVKNQSTGFVVEERVRAARWKAATAALPAAARADAPYVGHGKPSAYPFCLPQEHAALNLLPEVRNLALALFSGLGIPWHHGVAGGPSNHLLSSQVQCANALVQMVGDPVRIMLAFGHALDIDEVLEIEDGRYLTFEYIGPTDYFGEGRGGRRTRGTQCTSVDAAFRYRTSAGVEELALVEWKYTESYRPGVDASKTDERRRRYLADFEAADGPVRSDLVPFEAMLQEPFYQLMRQQLLARRLEQDPEVPASTVRVVHVLSPHNAAYQRSVHVPVLKEWGDTVLEIWEQLLRTPDRFVHLDPEVFCDPEVTSEEYVARYRVA